jgi:hypothetical protein
MKKLIFVLITLFIVKSFGLNNNLHKEIISLNRKIEVKAEPINFKITVTMYNAVSGQCDATPFVTACGGKINPKKASEQKWIAVSRDLLKTFKYGDKVRLSNAGKKNGIYTIKDCMARRFKLKVDILETENTPIYKLTGAILTKV